MERLLKIKDVEMVIITIQTMTDMKGSGQMIKKMEKESSFLITGTGLKEIGKTIKNVETGLCFIKMGTV
jgi:hypothetical protein